MAETLQFSTYLKPTKQSIPIVLLHGWGLNSGVWQPLIENLATEFTDFFHVITIDLPGFGANVNSKVSPYSLPNICQHIANTIEQPAIYLGWSLGGLVATEMALTYPEKVLGLITVASSPRFIEQRSEVVEDNVVNKLLWPGIKPHVLDVFHQQLQIDAEKTISGFLKLQAMGSPHVRQDIKQISELVFQYDMANKSTLDESLKLLETSDFRLKLIEINQPFLRLYGSADSLVPKSVIRQVAILAENNSEQHIFERASHAPFISHLDDFTQVLTEWLLTQFIR
jgi:pimeloyl-[acyl-carrier protein] methyl ester esterase|tara:strand:+ start:5480 stop:6328 length:849 start_codon:yes stop_codon:yes gene_type:complete